MHRKGLLFALRFPPPLGSDERGRNCRGIGDICGGVSKKSAAIGRFLIEGGSSISSISSMTHKAFGDISAPGFGLVNALRGPSGRRLTPSIMFKRLADSRWGGPLTPHHVCLRLGVRATDLRARLLKGIGFEQGNRRAVL